MSMNPLNAQSNPLGIFDGLDSNITSLLGGEVVGFTSINITSTDKHAPDVNDGYSGTTTKVRPGITSVLTSGMRPLYLADEGVAGYGTSFGQIVGGTLGQVITGGAQLGPHTTTGSGKVSMWGPGMYAISLDAVDTTALTGLVPANTSLVPGTALYATTAGKLTPAIGSAFEAVVVARFIEFQVSQSKSTTRRDMVTALNSPVGISTGGNPAFTQVVVYFHGGTEH
jgi:hypothetical protein